MATATKTKDALDLLKSDHKEVKKLLDQFEDSDEKSKRENICQQVIQELKIHSTIEEEIFYPAALKALGRDEKEIVLEAKEEHRVAKTLIEALDGLSASDEDFEAKFMVLAEAVRHHIKEEESEMFKELKKTALDLEELGERLTARKDMLLRDEQTLEDAAAHSDVKPYQELAKT